MRLAGGGWPSISYGSHGPHSVSSASARRWCQPARAVHHWSRSSTRLGGTLRESEPSRSLVYHAWVAVLRFAY